MLICVGLGCFDVVWLDFLMCYDVCCVLFVCWFIWMFCVECECWYEVCIGVGMILYFCFI